MSMSTMNEVMSRQERIGHFVTLSPCHPVTLSLYLLVCLLPGCGRTQFAPVSGVVRLNGQPLVGASVSFEPILGDKTTYGPGSHGLTDANGQYKLRVSTQDIHGAMVGKHTVRISLEDAPKANPG